MTNLLFWVGRGFERELLVADEAVDSGEALDEGEGEVSGATLQMQGGLEEAGDGGEGEQAGDHAGAVDGEGAEPLDEAVAPGFEDEELVAEVGDGDVEGGGENGGGRDGEVEVALREMVAEEEEDTGGGRVAEEGVEAADAEIAEELARGKEVDDALEAGELRGREVRLLRLGDEGGVLRVDFLG
jgi:hypothetical protein